MAPTVWRANHRFLARHPWQLFLTVLGITLGVAVVVAVDLANSSAMRAFRLSVEAVSGRATDQVVGGPTGVAEQVYTRLRVNTGVETIAPIVEGYGIARGETLHIVGIDPLAENRFQGNLASIDMDTIRRLLIQPGALLLAPATAQRLGLRIGEHFMLRCAGRVQRATFVALLSTTSTAASIDGLAITDIATAQEMTGRIGRLSWINLTLPADDAGVRMRIANLLPPGAKLISARTRTGALVQMTRAFRTNLTAMSLLALIVGMFLIYNTMTFAVLQRRRLIGTLRAMGVTRREIFGVVLGEAFILGLIGSSAGLLLGIALGQDLVHMVTRTINDLYFVVTVNRLLITPVQLAKGFALGLGVTLLAALVPALEAAGTTPNTALRRSALEQRVRTLAPRLALCGAALAAGALLLLMLPTKNLILGFAALFMMIVGLTLSAPLAVAGMAAAASAIVGRGLGPAGSLLARLALRGIAASLSRTGVAIAALMLAVATTVGVGVMVESFRSTVQLWLAATLRADVYVSNQTLDVSRAPPAIDPTIVARIMRVPGIAGVSRARRVTVESNRGFTQLLAIDFSPEHAPRFRLKSGNAHSAWAAFDADRAVLVSEPYAYRYDVDTGGRVRLRTDRGYRTFPVAGVFYDYGVEQGIVLIHRRLYEHYFHDHGVSSLGLYLRPHVSIAEVMTAVHAAAAGKQEILVHANREIRAASLRIFDRTFAITNVLRALAVLVAIVGILSALMALQLERARELAVLRATGLTPGQIWGLVTVQTGFMGLAAGILAIPVGLVLALLLIHVINLRAFGWSMPTLITPEVLVQALVLAVAAALLAGLYPGWRMARVRPADALREE